MKKWIVYSLFFLFSAFLFLFIQRGMSEEKERNFHGKESVRSATAELLSATSNIEAGTSDGRFSDLPPRWDMRMDRMPGRRGPGPRDGFPPMGMGPPMWPGPGRGPGDMDMGPGGRSMLRDRMESLDRMRQLRIENPELADLIEKIQRLRYQIESLATEGANSKEGEEQNRLKKKLQPLIEEEFDLELQRQDMEIDQMEKRLQQLRSALEKRKQFRDRIIELKTEQLITDPPISPSMQDDDMTRSDSSPNGGR